MYIHIEEIVVSAKNLLVQASYVLAMCVMRKYLVVLPVSFECLYTIGFHCWSSLIP